MAQLVKTHCELCAWACGMDVYVQDGKIVDIQGTKENPVNQGELCSKGKAAIELVYAPDRLKYPMRRKKFGWERMSWDDALDYISNRLFGLRDKYGAKSVGFYCGYPGVANFELAAFTQRFRSVFGSPNMFSVESMCYRSRIFARQTVFGTFLVEDPQKSNLIILWGTNPDESKFVLSKWLHEGIEKRGLKIIVIDPKKIPISNKGLFLQVRPGTDLALALAMMNVIISEGLYDKEFVDNYCKGFEELTAHVEKYTPEWAEEITWVSASEIKRVARIFAATKGAMIIHGINTQDQKTTGAQHNRAFAILQAITGNIMKPGTWIQVPFLKFLDLRVPFDERPIGAEEYPLFDTLWKRVSPYGQGMLLPKAILEEKPYAIKALLVAASNMALTFPNSDLIKKALSKLEFMVASEMFMTETTEFAHVVLPTCTFLERVGIGYVYAVNDGMPYVILRNRAIQPLYESWPDWKMWNELGRKMGYEKEFPWKSDEELTESLLTVCQVSYQDLVDHPNGMYYDQIEYEQFKKRKFSTPSGKIELFSETLDKAGFEPLPVYREPIESPVSNPKLAKEYPFILISGSRSGNYLHSEWRNLSSLREREPEPLAELHGSTARDANILDGEVVILETQTGKIKIRVKVNPAMAPKVISIPHGWAQSNANVLNDINNRDPITGFPELKPLQCRIVRL